MAATHTIAAGETLSVIAQKYGVTVDDLMKWNDLTDPNKIVAGKTLVVSAPAPVNDDPAINPVDHVVAKGETLGKIAKKYHVHAEDLAEWNNITDPNRLQVGQTLRIGPAGAQTYQVQPDEKVIGISKKLAVKWDVVARENKLANPDLIFPGQVLVIRQDARLR